MTEEKEVFLQVEHPVNVDTPESRLKRASNQFEFEKEKLDSLKGESFRKRFFEIRKGIFKNFENVEGENIEDSEEKGLIVSPLRESNEIHDQAVPFKEAAEIAMQDFEKNINSWYQQLKTLPEGEERNVATERFVAVLYQGGIMIHPAVDGNGQTFKIMCESYLRELHTECRDKYIPIKYEKVQDEEKDIPKIAIGGGWSGSPDTDISSYPVKPFKPADDEERTILDAIELVKKLSRRETEQGSTEQEFENMRSNAAEKAASIVRAVAHETNNDLFIKQVLEIGKTSDPGYILVNLRRVADKVIRDKGLHNSWEYNSTIHGKGGQKYERVSAVVVRLWDTADGRDLFENYIFDGTVLSESGEDVDSQLFYKVTKDLTNIRSNIMNVLESSDVHEERHQRLQAI